MGEPLMPSVYALHGKHENKVYITKYIQEILRGEISNTTWSQGVTHIVVHAADKGTMEDKMRKKRSLAQLVVVEQMKELEAYKSFEGRLRGERKIPTEDDRAIYTRHPRHDPPEHDVDEEVATHVPVIMAVEEGLRTRIQQRQMEYQQAQSDNIYRRPYELEGFVDEGLRLNFRPHKLPNGWDPLSLSAEQVGAIIQAPYNVKWKASFVEEDRRKDVQFLNDFEYAELKKGADHVEFAAALYTAIAPNRKRSKLEHTPGHTATNSASMSEMILNSDWFQLIVRTLADGAGSALHFNSDVTDPTRNTVERKRRDLYGWLMLILFLAVEYKRKHEDINTAVNELMEKSPPEMFKTLTYFLGIAASPKFGLLYYASNSGGTLGLTLIHDPLVIGTTNGLAVTCRAIFNLLRLVENVRERLSMSPAPRKDFRRPSNLSDEDTEFYYDGDDFTKIVKIPAKIASNIIKVYKGLLEDKPESVLKFDVMVDDEKFADISPDQHFPNGFHLTIRMPLGSPVVFRSSNQLKAAVPRIICLYKSLHKRHICYRDMRDANLIEFKEDVYVIDFEACAPSNSAVEWEGRRTLFPGDSKEEFKPADDLMQLRELIRDALFARGESGWSNEEVNKWRNFASFLTKAETAEDAADAFETMFGK